MQFKDKVVVITGSSRGIGKEIALSFAKEGAIVVINSSTNISALETLQEEIHLLGGRCLYFLGDVSDYDFVASMFETIHEKFNQVDILINNAGISYIGLFTETTPQQWKRIIDVNLTSLYNCCHAALPPMIRNHHGTILNISSIWGVSGASCEVAYSASKGGVNSFTKALARELGPSNIRVNAIACGVIDTQMNTWLDDDEKNTLIDQIPLMRMGNPKDVANLCLYLCSDAANYMTGQVITLDGGMI
ncbi:MAG: 3-oxoacyl-[acyl-carrier protein] reductase [Epulopiscium sp.]|uniref:Glucose 1-dehydrogenase n=2 Tax=Defluviitalea raffinosedens TaxID=1450156 RepID=A0A7C8HFD3_9FIRM|nr:SDR family oxidoreductase [Defluviitalea raffinosedens]MBZ4667519.1 fabG 2 [Defluviitaleaceae bacterium]MDK2787371.1 3-oxoacyl-[acyl-carrier protein] reductase [Candidatus Epulonipiscium sp.]KAE9635514.1 glucose 1-dehydrogenase [Defluviitalea raffinosedens]MBM7684425.1 3-oxoacyl-[acyl-carrier protein] reductase [Defluviitalea raffinosedens]HHW68468.1 SDR family oxidoreductase [Candidatus Epulonipiscium sp.]